jgi:hypothetical protein
MDPEDLENINVLLDRDVELREVIPKRCTPWQGSLSILLQKIKDQVTELDKKTRTMVGMLNKIHSTPSSSSEICRLVFHHFSSVVLNVVPTLMNSVRPTLISCQETSAAIAALIPPNQFWRWKDMWTQSLRTAIFAAALIEYVTNGSLISLPHVGEILGSKHVLLLLFLHTISLCYMNSQLRRSGKIDLHYPLRIIFTV